MYCFCLEIYNILILEVFMIPTLSRIPKNFSVYITNSTTTFTTFSSTRNYSSCCAVLWRFAPPPRPLPPPLKNK